MTLTLDVLGAAGAAPFRGACSAYLVTSDRATVLLDCGPGAAGVLWERELLGRLDAIVISHMHVDHVLDLVTLAGELGRRAMGERRVRLCVPRGEGRDVLGALDAAFGGSGHAGETRFDRTFAVEEHAVEDTVVVGDLRLTFAQTAHHEPCFAVRVSDGRAAIVYGTDGAPSPALAQLALGADLLLLEATFADDAEAAAAHGHMTARQAGAVAAQVGAGRLVLTHLLPEADDRHVDLAREAFTGPVVLAAPGLRVAAAG